MAIASGVGRYLNAAKNIAALHPQCTGAKGNGGVFRTKAKKKRKKKGDAKVDGGGTGPPK